MIQSKRPRTVITVTQVTAISGLTALASLAAVALAATDCSSAGSCTLEIPCPAHDVTPASGDFHLVLAATSSMTVTPTVLPIRGELLFAPPVCPSSMTTDGCTVLIKDLTIDFDTLRVETAVGDLHVDSAHLWIDAAVDATRMGKSYVVPQGTLMHTCALINGRRWHANAPTLSDLSLDLTVSTETANLTGTVPISLRAGDADCSQFLLSGDVLATGAAPWNTAP